MIHGRGLREAQTVAISSASANQAIRPRQSGIGWLAASGMAAAMLAMLNGCTGGTRALNDDERIVRVVLALLAKDGQHVCVDDETQGGALAVFVQMQDAPRAAQLDLHWHKARPLRPPIGALGDVDTKDGGLTIQEPNARKDALPDIYQLRLNGGAERLGGQNWQIDNAVTIRQSWVPRGVATRWWPLNRIRHDCRPWFEISNPMRDRDIAFVTVRSDHRGTLYALARVKQTWRIDAEWSRWLY